MNKGKTISAQIMSLIDEYEFKKCVDRYKGDRHAIKFNCRAQFMVMNLAQFTDRSSLRDIETTLSLCGDLYIAGIKVMSKSMFAETDEKKDWRIYQDFAMTLVKETTVLYKDGKLRIGLENMIYAFDISTFESCLNAPLDGVSPWEGNFQDAYAHGHERLDSYICSAYSWQGLSLHDQQLLNRRSADHCGTVP